MRLANRSYKPVPVDCSSLKDQVWNLRGGCFAQVPLASFCQASRAQGFHESLTMQESSATRKATVHQVLRESVTNRHEPTTQKATALQVLRASVTNRHEPITHGATAQQVLRASVTNRHEPTTQKATALPVLRASVTNRHEPTTHGATAQQVLRESVTKQDWTTLPKRTQQVLLASVRLLFLGITFSACTGDTSPFGKTAEPYDTWGAYLGDEGRRHFSALTQIDSGSLAKLDVAWTYKSGDGSADTRVQCNPLYGDGQLYVITAGLSLAALDAGTGTERWRFSPFQAGAAHTWTGQSRGMHLWRNADGALRVAWAVADRLYLLDAVTGQRIRDFGIDGEVDLRADLTSTVASDQLAVTTPGVVFGDLIILGFMTTERQPAVRGAIRAYDLRTGDQAWRFGTIPDEIDPAASTWQPDQLAAAAGANNWCGMALDVDRGLLFVPTGTAVDDFYGGKRLGNNLYANSLIALDAATGKRRWHQQLLHHDVWDYDLPSPPTLVEVLHKGQRVDAVAQPTKFGYLYVFHRETGESLFDITELAAPASQLPGEQTSPTQPHSALPPFVLQTLEPGDLHARASNIEAIRAQFAGLDRGLFAPPSFGGSLMSPGYDGGASWGGAGTVPGTGMLVLNANERPSIVRVRAQAGIRNPGERTYASACAGCHGMDRQGGTFHGNIPSLAGLYQGFDEASLTKMIHDGRGAMPAFAHLGQQALTEVSRFLLGLPVRDDVNMPLDTSYAHTGYDWFVDSEGRPAVRPPWGTLTRYDLDEGKIRWQVPLGIDSLWATRGDTTTGTINYGGPLLTATGLIFIGATTDASLRAFSQATGRQLWRGRLPADGVATPSTYTHEGRQYIVIAAGGGKTSTRRGDSYVAFALPRG